MSKSRKARLVDRGRELVAMAVVIGGLLGALVTFYAQEAERRLVFDTWQRVDARELSDDNVVVVMIDDLSVEAQGQWPWLRYHVAQLLDRIAAAEPAAIGIDVYFVEPDPLRPASFAGNYLPQELDDATRAEVLRLPNWDDPLAAIIGDARSPSVLARAMSDSGGKPASELTFDWVEGDPPAGTRRTDNVIASIDKFDINAFSHGFVDGLPDSDGVIRRVPLSVWAGESLDTGFAVELAKVKEGVETLRWDGPKLMLGERAIPADDEANFNFKMSLYNDDYEEKIIPAIALFYDDFDRERLRGKVVILGVGATGTYDIVATPLGSEIPGPVVQAQAVDAILTGDWLSYPAWSKAVEIVAAAGLLLLMLLAGYTMRNWLIVTAGVLAIALPIGSYLAYVQAGTLFDPLRPLLVGMFAAGGLFLARYGLAVAELIDKRIQAELQARENENARKMQMSMIPSPASLASLSKRAEIGAVLEPARSVGGDFYDAMRISKDQVLFLVGDVSGKGMPAALFMALSKTVSKSKFASAGDGLAQAVEALNDELMDDEDQEMDLTMLVGMIDCSTGTIELVNAGHEDPLIVSNDGSVTEHKMQGGPRLCALPGFPYPVEQLQLARGETLVVITDGATDAANTKDVRFGLDGVIAALGSNADISASERAQDLAGKVRMFEGNADPADDLTIFALRYLGNQ